MSEDVEKLKREIENLQNELAASMRREELLQNPANGGGTLKQRLKRTATWRIIADPKSKMGKLARSPRTIYRIVKNPNILKEKFQDEQKQGGGNDEEKSLLMPIKFYFSEDTKKRVNLVIEKLNDEELLKKAIELANKDGAELRIITYGEGAATMKYKKLVDAKKVPKAKEISFYSSKDQKFKKYVFELEVGKNEIFLTRAWKNV